MKTIWKFKVDAETDKFHLDLPKDAWVLHVAHGFIWIEGSFSMTEEVVLAKRKFQIIGTGHDVPESYRHVGTYFEPPFVWHVYMEV